MKDSHSHHHGSQGRRKSQADGPGIQVICLGSGGGPSENDITGLLVRSTSSKWAKASILAVDAGCHLAAITSILSHHFPFVAPAPPPSVESDDSKRSSSPEEDDQARATVLTSGPFAGLSCPHASARANAVHVVREHVSTYLITHPHLDHLCGFAINTAAFHNTSRPKRLAALPFTVNAIKNNIFNDVIWPNLTDEDNGVGFVTFQRLTEGGNLALGDGESRGFIEVCDGLAVKGFKVSHGVCASRPPQPSSATVALQESLGRRGSLPTVQEGWVAGMPQNNGVSTPAKSMSMPGETPVRRSSLIYGSQPATPASTVLAQQANTGGAGGSADHQHMTPIVDSSAFFIRAEQTHHAGNIGREILVFGDVEPDSISAMPRNQLVWAEAAPKIVSGVLKAVFIECSYSDVQPDAVLFGHLAPRHLVQELITLSEMVTEERRRESLGMGSSGMLPSTHQERERKRKRTSVGGGTVPVRGMHAVDGENGVPFGGGAEVVNPGTTSIATATATATTGATTPRNKRRGHLLVQTESASKSETQGQAVPDPLAMPMDTLTDSATTLAANSVTSPLHGFTVVVIHVKDTLIDGPLVGDLILADLQEHEARLAAQGRPLGCEFIVSKSGESYWF